MGYIVSFLIVVLCLYLIIRPFFQEDRKWRRDGFEDDLDQLTLEQIYVTLNELEMEHNMRKLPDKEYNDMKKLYEKLAAQKLKEEAFQKDGAATEKKQT